MLFKELHEKIRQERERANPHIAEMLTFLGKAEKAHYKGDNELAEQMFQRGLAVK